MKVPAEQSSPFGLAPEKDQTIVAPPAPDMQVAAAGAATSSPIPERLRFPGGTRDGMATVAIRMVTMAAQQFCRCFAVSPI